MSKAVVLLSGGLDSTTCMGVAVHAGYEVYPISFNYSQRHSTELESAVAVARFYQIPEEHHLIVNLGNTIRGSALTGDAEVPLGRDLTEMGEDIPVTYVPSRNMLFLAHAASYAETVGADFIYIGVNALDYSGYPDCRPQFIAAMQEAFNTGTKMGAEGHAPHIEAPLQHLSKAEIVKLATSVGAPLHLSYTCYTGSRPSCGECDSCKLRIKGFQEAGVKDPIPYAVAVEWDL